MDVNLIDKYGEINKGTNGRFSKQTAMSWMWFTFRH